MALLGASVAAESTFRRCYEAQATLVVPIKSRQTSPPGLGAQPSQRCSALWPEFVDDTGALTEGGCEVGVLDT